jgi:hypothetical protein
VKAVGTKDEGKPEVGQASSDIPALKPYWGKPAVRNFRGAMETSASFEARSAPLPYPTQRGTARVPRVGRCADKR